MDNETYLKKLYKIAAQIDTDSKEEENSNYTPEYNPQYSYLGNFITNTIGKKFPEVAVSAYDPFKRLDVNFAPDFMQGSGVVKNNTSDINRLFWKAGYKLDGVVNGDNASKTYTKYVNNNDPNDVISFYRESPYDVRNKKEIKMPKSFADIKTTFKDLRHNTALDQVMLSGPHSIAKSSNDVDFVKGLGVNPDSIVLSGLNGKGLPHVTAHELGHILSHKDNSLPVKALHSLQQPGAIGTTLGTSGLSLSLYLKTHALNNAKSDKEREEILSKYNNRNKYLALLGTVGYLPTIAEEIRASHIGSKLLPSHYTGKERLKPYSGVPTYLMQALTPAIMYAGDRILDKIRGY